MNLRKFIFVFILFFAIKSLSAQTSNFKFGVKGGLNLSTAIVGDGDSKFKQGYNIGGTVDYLFTSKFELQSGLFLSKTGSIINDLDFHSLTGADLSKLARPYSTHTFNTTYLKLPLHLAFRKNISDNFNFYTGFGVYFGYGIGGKTKHWKEGGWRDCDENLEPIFIKEFKWGTFRYGNDWWGRSKELSRFDFGAGVNAGIEFHKFVLGTGFEYGLINVINKESRPYTYKFNGTSLKAWGMIYRNVNISISTGYRF